MMAALARDLTSPAVTREFQTGSRRSCTQSPSAEPPILARLGDLLVLVDDFRIFDDRQAG